MVLFSKFKVLRTAQLRKFSPRPTKPPSSTSASSRILNLLKVDFIVSLDKSKVIIHILPTCLVFALQKVGVGILLEFATCLEGYRFAIL